MNPKNLLHQYSPYTCRYGNFVKCCYCEPTDNVWGTLKLPNNTEVTTSTVWKTVMCRYDGTYSHDDYYDEDCAIEFISFAHDNKVYMLEFSEYTPIFGDPWDIGDNVKGYCCQNFYARPKYDTYTGNVLEAPFNEDKQAELYDLMGNIMFPEKDDIFCDIDDIDDDSDDSDNEGMVIV